MSNCETCIQLLQDHAAAANDVLALKRCPDPLCLALATARKHQTKARLLRYLQQHPCNSQLLCPNQPRPIRIHPSSSALKPGKDNHPC